MPQLSLYLDKPTMDILETKAQREGYSLSKYAGKLIREHDESTWPVGFWDLYGSIDDPAFACPSDPDFNDDDPCDFFN
ncbi:MAG: antitoxin [Gordonibacter sp.]|uniref:antitoxin n=1 Tax=Gordonibacter sp. TaxID=1968902 RepID=UPI00322064A5